jgi:hypothetical protein
MPQDNRQSLLDRPAGPNPWDDLSVLIPALKQRDARGKGRKSVRPTDRRRQQRMTTITFSDPNILDRLRNLAQQWGWLTNNGSPHVSRVVEHLLLPGLEDAEQSLTPEAGQQWL